MGERELWFTEKFERVLRAWSSDISDAIASFLMAVEEPRRIFRSFAERNAELFEALRSFDVVFPALVEDMVSPMVSLGWYPDLEMPFATLSDVVDVFKTDPVSAEKGYAAFLATELSTVQERLMLSCPSRRQLYEDGFDAHQQGLYFSSIPVFLAQAEGLVWERLGAVLYSRKKFRERMAELKNETWSLSQALMWPLLEPTDINKTAGERTKRFSGLNRHRVLHGEDITYGTKRNSLKAISHLLFVSDILKHIDDSS